jgi:effector-binding domain-containing protein
MHLQIWRAIRPLAFVAFVLVDPCLLASSSVMASLVAPAQAQAQPAAATPAETPAVKSATPPASPAPSTPSTPPAAAPPVDDKALGTDTAPPSKTQIENNAAPGVPENATTETVEVPARAIAMIAGKSTYDDAFKSIKASLDTVAQAVAKAGLTPSGHPITIFSEPDENGFKYQAAIPLGEKPAGKDDLGNGVKIGASPSGKAIKFQHRGAYDDIDSTYDVITAYLDAKGLQVDNPYIEEYLTDLKNADDPNLQVDIYVFMK